MMPRSSPTFSSKTRIVMGRVALLLRVTEAITIASKMALKNLEDFGSRQEFCDRAVNDDHGGEVRHEAADDQRDERQ